MNMFMGLRVNIVPKTVSVERTIKERLFSRPWKPMLKTKYVDNPSAPEEGKFHKIGLDIFCTQETFNSLKGYIEKQG